MFRWKCGQRRTEHAEVIVLLDLTSLSTKRDLERKFTTEGGGGGRPPSDLECEVFSGGLSEPSRITHQLGKGDLKSKI